MSTEAKRAEPCMLDTVLRMKVEVLHDIAEGKVPKAVKSFADLGDYVDPREYGGFCDDAESAAMIAAFGGRDASGAAPQDYVEYMSCAQKAIDLWIRSGECAKVAGG